MGGADGQAARRGLIHRALLLALGLSLGFSASVLAADFPDVIDCGYLPPAPRFFPRGDGADAVGGTPAPGRLSAACRLRGYVPTDAPDDPSYVGSNYGLGKPSYYGFRPALGHDDPFGRPLRRCP